MSFLQTCLFVLVGVLLSLFLKAVKPEYCQILSLGVGVTVLCLSAGKLKIIFQWLGDVMETCGDYGNFFPILIKMIGVSYASEITHSICKDAGYSAVGEEVEIFSRIILCFLSFPVLKEILNLVLQIEMR